MICIIVGGGDLVVVEMELPVLFFSGCCCVNGVKHNLTHRMMNEYFIG